MEEESTTQILFETRHHASMPYLSNYPPLHQQLNEGAKSSYISRFLSSSGIAQLKERWRKPGHRSKVRKCASLFVSSSGDFVAVASGNQITILQKKDDYQKPCGIFICKNITSFSCGAWSETHDVLGVADDSDTVYLIRANGEEITRISRSHIKSSSPIVGLIVQDDADLKKSCLCTFTILTADGLIHDIEISQDPSASVFSPLASSSGTMLKQLPQNMFCLDYHPELSLFAVVSSGGSLQQNTNGLYSLSLCRKHGNLVPEVLVSTEFEGFFSIPKGYVGHIVSPKVLLSPQGTSVATLDMGGSLITFKFDDKQCSLSRFSYGEGNKSHHGNKESAEENNLANEVVDFAWWSEDILAVAERNGNITMINISTGARLFKDETVYSLPLLERVPQLSGKLFVLETIPSIQNSESTEEIRASIFHLLECDRGEMNKKFDWADYQWTVVSFSERSIPEMYDILISRQEYEAALMFADQHGLNKDETLKSQWLHSSQGLNEIKTLLPNIKDQVFVLTECVGRFGPTEDAVRALLDLGLYITDQYRLSESEVDEHSKIWDFLVARLKLLQYRDRLETFLGINSRFSVPEYKKFCTLPIKEAAIALAESGKIGALNLLFKRHPYSLTSSLLDVLAAIPETLPVQTYGQLLPGNSPPPSISLREEDWVECDEMVTFVISRVPESHESYTQIRTEPIVKQFMGSQWPSVSELSSWYKKRARDIDTLSGQLDNSMSLIDAACRKGIHQLQPFLEEISYLHELIYAEENEEMNFSMSLTIWESLPDYERFKLMLRGVKEDTVLRRLHSKAIPFMKKRFHSLTVPSRDEKMDSSSLVNSAESFLVRWLKEIAAENKLEMCSVVIEEGSREVQNYFFQNEAEVVDCALQCIYACSVTDRWSTMASILSKLPFSRVSEAADLKERMRLAEGHVEAGRILALYQVSKPLSFFQEAYSDEKAVNQMIRLILSKFVRRQPARSDNDWTNMWHDLQSLQEKAFHFIDLEYVLMEFCRGLLKAGKFSLARNYLKGVGSVSLANDKAENLVIQAAREYFYSASGLSSSEIWKAKECLNILPTSRNVRVEADIIDAITVKLPNLGVTLLPMQYKQIKDPMEVVKLVVTSQGGAYLNVDEIIELAKLLGLSSHDDISAVQEAIAREAAVVGDLQLAFDLCLVLAKKGHGSVWDLCAALARGPALENMDIASRKQLLGFALSHCDGESIAELLHAWKDLDMQGQCDSLMVLTGKEPGNDQESTISYQLRCTQDKTDLKEWSDQEAQLRQIESVLFQVAKNVWMDGDQSIPSILRENGKLLSFASVYLPWLLELSEEAESSKKFTCSSFSGNRYVSLRTQAVVTILSWLARNGFSPKDSLIASVAKSIMEPPVTEEEDIIGCAFLLNLADAFSGVEIIESNLRTREKYNEVTSIMNVGMIYSLLHNCGINCEEPAQRRMLILTKFQQKHKLICSEEKEQIDQAQSTFWREWKLKLEEQKRLAERSRSLEQIIPGVETTHFLSGDMDYRESVVFSFVESLTPEKKHNMKDVLKLANSYSLDCNKVVLHYLRSIFISEAWSTTDVKSEVSNLREDLLTCPAETIKFISSSIYPAVDGHDKQKLSLIYALLYDCHLQLDEQKDPVHSGSIHLAHLSRIIEEECCRVSFIEDLNFKNVVGIQNLNLDCFNSEVSAHINANNVEALAKMVQNLVALHGGPVPDGLLSWQYVYKHHALSLLTKLEDRAKSGVSIQSSESLHYIITEIEQSYNTCCKYLRFIPNPARMDILKRFLAVILSADGSSKSLPCGCGSAWQVCLAMLVDTWLRMMNDMHEVALLETSEERFSLECIITCLKVFARLVAGGKVSSSQGWATIFGYAACVLVGDVAVEIYNFCRAMVCSGCGFGAVADVYNEVMAHFLHEAASVTEVIKEAVSSHNLQHLYLSILETILQEFTNQSLEHQCLLHYLSSLSKLDGDLENLQCVRQAVWERLEKFSENFQLPNHVRVYTLELMQLVAATDKNSSGFSSGLQVEVHSWEGWSNLHSATANSENTAADGISNKVDASNRFTNTLIALKSAQLVSTISPSIEITPEDLLTVDSAVSCFLEVSKFVASESHIETLLALLREWEGHFTWGHTEKDSGEEVSDGGNSWSNDDWDEGWESFQEPIVKEPAKDTRVSVHPLHVCWMEIFKKLLAICNYDKMLKLLDESTAKPGGVLLDEEDARGLSQIALEVDCFLAIKLMLLLPYEVAQLHCLDTVEQKLKQEGISDKIGMDLEFLVLILSSGVLSTIITKSSYGTIFSYLCYMVGNFSRQCQESQLSNVGHGGSVESEHISKSCIDVFTRLILPCFVSELVSSGQQILAGFVVAKFIHANPSLSLVNIAGACLTKYLERQIQILQDSNPSRDGFEFSEPLLNTISSLKDRMGNLIRSSLPLLSNDCR